MGEWVGSGFGFGMCGREGVEEVAGRVGREGVEERLCVWGVGIGVCVAVAAIGMGEGGRMRRDATNMGVERGRERETTRQRHSVPPGLSGGDEVCVYVCVPSPGDALVHGGPGPGMA